MKTLSRFLAVWLLSVAAFSVQAATVTINSVTINRSSDINFDNGLSVTIDDAAGTPRDVVTLDSGDDLILGGTGIDNVLITFPGGQSLIIDGAVTFDAGVVTGATSITSTNFVGIIDGALGSVTPAAIIGTTGTLSGLLLTTDATEATDTTTASLKTAGGVAWVKDAYVGDDMFFTSGAVLNFNAGNYTFTHSAGAMAFAGGIFTIPELTFSVDNPEILGNDTNGVTIFSSGATTILGGSMHLYGDTHASQANDVEFYGAATLQLFYDESNSLWDFQANAVTTTGVITGVTLEATGDVTAADNAAIGYTATLGVLITGQGSTNDITLLNDAKATVMEVATGTVNIEFTAGNLIVGTAAKGVDFSITTDGAGSATSELLDDYEEGTCTLLPSDAVTAGNTATPSAEECFYTVIGRLVTVIFTLTNIDITGMTTGNDFFIQGMPYANNATIIGEGSVTVDTVTYDTDLTVQIATGASAFRLAESKTSTGIDYTTVSNLSDDTSDISGVITYMK